MRNWLIALLVGSVYLWAYSAASAAGFVYEDRHSVVEVDANASVAFGAHRSLTQLSFQTQAGAGPQAHHALNIALGAAVAALVGLWIHTLGLSGGAAWIGMVMMLLHPMSVEAIAYIGGRAELIAALFMMAALCLANVVGRGSILALPSAVLTSLLAGTGKESGLMACLFVPSSFALRRAWWRAAIAATAISGIGWWAYGGRMAEISHWMHGGSYPWPVYSSLEWLRWQATAAVRMVGMIPIPRGNNVVFDVEMVPIGLQWLSVWWLVALCGVAVWLVRRCGHAAAGLAMMLAVVAPRLVVPTPNSVFNEHQFYTVMPGAALMVAAAWDRFAPERIHG